MLKNRFNKRVSLENWTKNHKTGQFEQVTKIKPATLMKGRAHIEIFDAYGKIEQEAVTENVICDGVNKFFSQLLQQQIMQAMSRADAMATNVFGRLIANNYATAESASISYFPNVLTYPTIAWCNKNEDYSGTDLLRGDINKTETSLDTMSTPGTNEVTIVMDWNTDQANGTFQSLFWVPDNTNPDDTDRHTFLATIGYAYWNNANMAFGKSIYEDTAFIVAINGVVYSLPLLLNFAETNWASTYGYYWNNALEAAVALKDYSVEATSPSQNDSVFSSSTNYYVFCPNDDKVYVYNTSWVYQSEFALSDTTYMQGTACMEFDSTNFYTVKRVDATNINIYKFDSSGTLVNTYNMYTDVSEDFTPQGIAYDGTNLIIIDTNSRYYIYSTTGVIQTVFNGPTKPYASSMGLNFNKNFNFISFYPTSSYDKFYCYSWSATAPSAHTLLAAPVTKTTANTMKVTYTFSFDLTAL